MIYGKDEDEDADGDGDGDECFEYPVLGDRVRSGTGYRGRQVG